MARRERRRRGTQYTGILRSDRNRTTEERPLTQHSVERGTRIRWRLVSGLIVVCMSGLLALFFMTDVFYVRSIGVSGLQYMTKEEVFTYSEIANQHVFWVEPDEIRTSLMEYRTVADARVTISFPPNMVSIIVEERDPAILWEQGGTIRWVDISGNIMAQRDNRTDLVRVQVVDPELDLTAGDTRGIDTDIVFGALQLHELRPDVGTWRYDAVRGLGFRNNAGWNVWFGIGTGMPEKLKIYERIASDIISQGLQAGEVNVVDPDAPFFTVVQ